MTSQVATIDENADEVTVAQSAQTESAAIFSMIERAASDPSIDMDKMERLLQMQKDVRQENARVEYNSAMARAQREMEPVARDARNDQTRSNYARYEAIAKAITPIITKHGFAASFGTADSPKENHYRITCEVSHEGGFSKSYHADIPIDDAGMKGTKNKTGTHAFGSTMSYGRRYLKLLIFDIATEDDDGNASSKPAELITEDQVMALRDLLETANRDEAKFCQYVGVNALQDIWAENYDKCIAMIQRTMKASA